MPALVTAIVRTSLGSLDESRLAFQSTTTAIIRSTGRQSSGLADARPQQADRHQAWGTAVSLAAPPWRIPHARSVLGTPGGGRLWVLAASRSGGPSNELFEVDPSRRRVVLRMALPPDALAAAAAHDGAVFVASPLEIDEWWSGRQERFPMPTGTEAIALAPASHSALWLAFRLGTTGGVEVGLYRLPDEVLVDAHHVAGMANEAVASLAAAPGGCWVASAPRPSLYWVPAQGGPSTYTRRYATLVAVPDAGSLTTVAVDTSGSGWVSGATTTGRPVLWPIEAAEKIGAPRTLSARVVRLADGLGVSPVGTGYAAVIGAKDVPGIVGASTTRAATVTLWPSLTPKGRASRDETLDTVLVTTNTRLYAMTPPDLLLSLVADPTPVRSALRRSDASHARSQHLGRRSLLAQLR